MSKYGKNKSGRDGEWIITLTKKTPEEDNASVGNTLFWLKADANGGWTRLLTKCHANGIVMDGARCPKTDAAIRDSLQDSKDSLSLRGHTVVVPTAPISFSKLVKLLIDGGYLPNPTPVGQKADNSTNEPPLQLAAAFVQDVDQNLHQIGVTPDPLSAPPVDQVHGQNAVENPAQMPAALSNDQEQPTVAQPNGTNPPVVPELPHPGLVHPDGSVVEANLSGLTSDEVNMLTGRIALLEDYVTDLERKNKTLNESLLQKEERHAIGCVENAETLTKSVKATIDQGLTNMAGGMEFRLNREMTHVSKEINDLLHTTLVPTIDDLSQQIQDCARSAAANNELLIGLNDKVDRIAANDLVQHRDLKVKIEQHDGKLATINRAMGQLGVNVAEILKVSKAMRILGSEQPSAPLLTSTPKQKVVVDSRPPAPLKCTYCKGEGHGFTHCMKRPLNHMCVRCRSPQHADEDCPTIGIACIQCKQLGHSYVLHATTDPAERMKILGKFGEGSIKIFKEFFMAPNASKRTKYQE